MNRTTILSLVLLSASAAQLCGQDAPVPATRDILQTLSLRSATVQTLVVPDRADRTALVAVQLGHQTAVLELEPFEIRSPDFKLLVQTADGGIVEAEPAAPVTMRGRVLGMAHSRVIANVIGGGLEAAILLPNSTWWITPTPTANNNQHTVFLQTDVIPLDAKGGGIGRHSKTQTAGEATSTGIYQEADIYVDADHAYYLAQGGGLPQVTQAAATAQINLVSGVYEGQVGVGYTVNAVYVQAVFEQYSAGATGTWADMTLLLSQLSNFWNTHPLYSGLSRDAVHLLSGKGGWTGFVGIANIGVICQTSAAYAVSRVVNTNPAYNNTLVAHEFGHNWNAQHCSGGTAGCGIMASTIGTSLSFGPAAVAAITGFAATRTCLDPAARASYSFFGAGCVGSSGLTPQLTNASMPLVGQNWSINVTQCPPNAPVTVFLGYSNTSWGSIPLPLDLTPWQMPGCWLLTAIDLKFPLTANGAGTATLSVALPNITALLGLCFYNQGQVVDAGANPKGLTVSNAGSGIVGNR